MTNQHVIDFRIEQRVVGRQDSAARIAEDDFDAFGYEALDDDLCSRKFFHLVHYDRSISL